MKKSLLVGDFALEVFKFFYSIEITMSLTMSSILKNDPFFNWTRILENNARNITTHHIEIHSDHDDDISSIVIVGVGIVMMIVMWILHKCSKEDRPVSCCKVQNDSEHSDSVVHIAIARPSESTISGLAGVLSQMKRKDSPPPPYEDPPSYHLAVQMEIQLKKSGIEDPDL